MSEIAIFWSGAIINFFEISGVDISKSVIVSGVTNTEKDNEVLDILKPYGKFKKIYVDDETWALYKNLIIEYHCNSAIAELKKNLPYTHISESNPDIKFCVAVPEIEKPKTESTVPVVVPPPDYMKELKCLARRSGQKFETVLHGLLSQINEHLENMEDETPSGQSEHMNEGATSMPTVSSAASTLPGQQGMLAGATSQAQSHTATRSSPSDHQIPHILPQRLSLSHAEINPPEIQKVVVEHIVRTEELTTHSIPTLRLRPFSGKTPKPEKESDYESWRSHIELLLADVNLPPVQVTRKIIESLLSPAADVVKGLKPDTLPSVYLQVLDSAYSTVQDGEELFAQFLNTLQDPGEKPSSYLQRLLLTLNTAFTKRGNCIIRH